MKRPIRVALFAGVVLAMFGAGMALNAGVRSVRGRPNPPSAPQLPQIEAPPPPNESLAKLRPGMLLADVEAVLGPPARVDSVQASAGMLRYRATFSRDRQRPLNPPLVLVFDASQPGHPLLLVQPM